MKEQQPIDVKLAFERQTREVYGQPSVELPVALVNPFFEGQVRKTYEQDDIAGLADSLAENDLLHPLLVAELEFLEAVEYVNGINELWGTAYSASNLTENETGNYYILIAGHRRLLAIYHNISDSGQGRNGVNVHCNVRRGIGLTEALKLQYTENTHKAVEAGRDALAIKLYYNRRLKELRNDNKLYSYSQCARELGVNRQRVSDAERYFTLPAGTRKTVDAGLYTYNWVLRLVDLHKNLQVFRPNMTETDRVKDLNVALMTSYEKKFTPAAFERYLEDRIAGLAYEQQMLIMSEQFMTPQDRANRAAEHLILRAIDDIQTALGHLALGHIDDPRSHPVISRRVADAEQILRLLHAPRND